MTQNHAVTANRTAQSAQGATDPQTRRQMDRHLTGLGLTMQSYRHELITLSPAMPDTYRTYLETELAKAVAEYETLWAKLYHPQPAAQPQRTRCPHYASIREFFAAAKRAGLDVTAAGQDRCRGAVGMLLGRRVVSRSELTAAEWEFCCNAVQAGRLIW